MRTFFLILILLSTLSYANFFRINGVVHDNSTALEWQDNYVEDAKWVDAIDYCEKLILDGKNDWRLPSINELNSLVDDTKYNPAINSIFINTNLNRFYWSSTIDVNFSETVWVVDFNKGINYTQFKSYHNYIRCVRSSN